KQSGLTLALSTPVTDSLLEANRSIKRGGQVSNDKLKALYGIKAATEMAMAADNLASTLDTLGNMSSATYDPSAAGNANVKLSLSVGASQSKRES
ncbi:hypothetical protein RYD26_12785, partial [Pasteurellaceae bacterium LIM206]|nr:hypothetical protein [Pasteurellaceae bacterium LIM206]